MSGNNIHSINQDDVFLGGEASGGYGDELSPSEFGNDQEEMGAGSNDSLPKKKGSSILTVIVGILAALGIVGFFGWKIAAPYFSSGQTASAPEAFAPNAVGSAPAQNQLQQFAPVPSPVPSQPAAVQPQGNVGQPMAPTADPFAPQAAAPAAAVANDPQVAVKVSADKIVIGPAAPAAAAAPAPGMASPASAPVASTATAAPTPVAAVSSAPAPTTPVVAPSVMAEDIARIDKRIDSIDAALVALKDTVAKLQGEIQKSRAAVASKPNPAPAVAKAAAPKPAPETTVAAKSNSPAGQKRAGAADKGEGASAEGMSAHELQLQAVLQDRAWFKTKTGETVTVAPGEELRGVGVVKQIDAEGGRVVFANGVVFR